jgi:hypothetical protein
MLADPGYSCAPYIDAPYPCPRQDSNLRSRLRRAMLYPLSYGGRSRAADPAKLGKPISGQ